MENRFRNKNKIQKMCAAHKLSAFTCAICLLLCTGGCGVMDDDFFAYAPKSHIITKEEETAAYLSETAGENGQDTIPEDTGNPEDTGTSEDTGNPEQNTENVQAGDAGQEERLIENVEYDEDDADKVKGIIRDMPFVYRGVRLSYTGDPEADFAVEEQPLGRPVPATVNQSTEQGGNPSEPQDGEEEPPLNLGTVNFNGEFYEGHLKFDNEFMADITIAYSEAGPLTPEAAIEIWVPVQHGSMDDDEDVWYETVRTMLCDAIPGKNGRTYAIVRTREGSLDLLQYSFDYKNASGEVCHIRVIASFFGGVSEAQGVELLDRLDFKYVGENT